MRIGSAHLLLLGLIAVGAAGCQMAPRNMPAGECPTCAGNLVGFRRTADQKFDGVVRCKKCGYFYVVRA